MNRNEIVREIKSLRRVFSQPGSPYFHVRKMIHGAAVRDMRRRGLLLMDRTCIPDSGDVIQKLERDGYAPVAAEHLSADILSRLAERYGHEPAPEISDPQTSKRFWRRLLDRSSLTFEDDAVRLCTSTETLSLVTAYLGESPLLIDVDLFLSFGRPDTNIWEESQLWHRDYNDTRMLKLFIYLSDVVDDADGPFTFLPAAMSRQVPNSMMPGRVPDEVIARMGLAGQVQRVLGPRFTAFWIDTHRCYHQGSRVALGHSRLAYTATFVTHAALWRDPPLLRTPAGATPLQALICGQA
jgi:hypothetical protein